MHGVLGVLGALWCLPWTVLGLLAALVLRSQFVRREGTVLVFAAGEWMRARMEAGRWAGFSCGDVVLVAPQYLEGPTLQHELRHAAQAHVFGPLMPVVYALGWLVAIVREWRAIYRANPMEVDARRAAGQEPADGSVGGAA